MFRKRATKTYERRRPGTHSASSIASTIIREDVPPDRNVRSKELSDVESGDDTMDDDPFDTTFDRLLKTAKYASSICQYLIICLFIDLRDKTF